MSHPFYAHSGREGVLSDAGHDDWQLLACHLKAVAEEAARFAKPLGMETEARAAGLLHDLGKYSERFQARLRDPRVRHINHWSAGAAAASACCKVDSAAFAIEGHHAGLPALRGNISLQDSLQRMLNVDPSRRKEHTNCSESVDELISLMRADGVELPQVACNPLKKSRAFEDSLRTRMLFSCLVDADYLDTERHFSPGLAAERRKAPLAEAEALDELLCHLRTLETRGKDGRRGVNALRTALLRDCLEKAACKPGLFTLTAPTGSGKTLASLAFALRHAVENNRGLAPDDPRRLRRIIVVIPYTSIIEQTARTYRDILAERMGENYILEHHSSVWLESKKKEPDEERAENRVRLAQENWDSPLVVTTSVQFFESLFGNRPSKCRKLHNIARSIILFDEVQTLPKELAPSLLSAVRLLSRDYGSTCVFMTATQPAFGSIDRAALPYGWDPVEISSSPRDMAQALRRTRIRLPKTGDNTTWEGLARDIAAQRQALCVVNATQDAQELFVLLRKMAGEGTFHLSTKLCPAHRRRKLDEIRVLLKAGKPCRLVSTQLIEAGVDVDFPAAWRALGPLDSIIQTAGRCNREGHNPEPCPVTVFRIEGMHSPPGAYRTATEATGSFLSRVADADDLFDPGTYARYFEELYKLSGPESAEADKAFAACRAFDFPEAAEKCRLIGDETRPVIVKWGRGAELAKKLAEEKHLTPEERREAQRYSVNFFTGKFNEALNNGWVSRPAEDWDFYVWESDYDENLGVRHKEGVELIL
ncbi:MAG TPA: CRISPR-associated helicase Cas3' [Opitutales bacterium]|nr:CRISPR-associated helicase Cas3' [Opitutales bacterium]